jgi:hypothetical protein
VTEQELAGLRIPVTDGPWPHREQARCVIVVAVIPEGKVFAPGLEPTGGEALMIASFIAYNLSIHLYPHQIEEMREDKFDTWHQSPFVLCHVGENGWKYNRPHWRQGPLWAPYEVGPLTLAGLLDHIEQYGGDRWAAWKAEHPEVFQ